MSDFLRNLVVRSQAPLDVVRPRAASMFEPTAPVPAALRSWETPAEQAEELEADDDQPDARLRPRVRPRSRVDAVERGPRLESEAEAPAETRAPRPAEPPPAVPSRATAEQSRERPPEQHLRAAHVAEPDVTARVIRETAAQTPTRSPYLPTHDTRELHEIFHTRDSVIDRESREALTPAGTPAAQTRQPLAHARSATAAEAVSRVREALVTQQIPATPQPEPVIHVSIGRIEVRAIAENQNARKPREAPPVMGLDEYLRQRARGAGR